MLSIKCPVCGERPESEFFCLGEGKSHIPALDESEEEVYQALYVHDNSAGVIRERWVHRRGCQEWLSVERDTRTNTIKSVGFMDAFVPMREEA